MKTREMLLDCAKGDRLWLYWKLFFWRGRTASRLLRDIQTFILYRMAHRHGGYIGREAAFRGRPVLPHGLHGVFISRYASIGTDCWIYQNVTIGESGRKAPQIGDHCLIGAGAAIIGDVKIGDYVKIGAGAVVFTDLPSHATAVAQPPRIIVKERQ